MRELSFPEFYRETFGGRPNQMDVSGYVFHEYRCGCGRTHAFDPVSTEVVRELKGMRLVMICPDRLAMNLVKVHGVLIFKGFETLAYTRDWEGVPQSEDDTMDLLMGAALARGKEQEEKPPGWGCAAAMFGAVLLIGILIGRCMGPGEAERLARSVPHGSQGGSGVNVLRDQ